MHQVKTEIRVGKTLFIVTAECSPTATETIEKKLERLICRHFSDTNSYQPERDKQFAMYSNQSEYGSDTIFVGGSGYVHEAN